MYSYETNAKQKGLTASQAISPLSIIAVLFVSEAAKRANSTCSVLNDTS